MKKLHILFIVFCMLIISNTFSQSIKLIITQSESQNDDFSKSIATYNDIDTREDIGIMTLIKPNGDVVKHFDLEIYFAHCHNQAEVDELLNKLAGSTFIKVSLSIENDTVQLIIGDIINDSKNMVNISSVSTSGLDFSRETALFDIDKKTAIYCIKN
jgi:hypothetical protein